MGLYNDRKCFEGNIFGGIPRTSPMALAQHHLRRCCCRFAVTHLPQCECRSHFPSIYFSSLPISLSPLLPLMPSVFGVYWAAPRLRFVASFARSSCFQADFQCQRFGDNEVWTGIVSFTFFSGLFCFDRCVFVARVFSFFSFSKQEFTHTIYVNILTHLHRSAYELVWGTINGL